jgi:hypothetical protein
MHLPLKSHKLVSFFLTTAYQLLDTLCARSTRLDFYIAKSLEQQSASTLVALLRHIILILSQPVFALSP